jgi:UDP-3-O-acyl-N-acetylglucosamine deacetylase
VALRAGHELHTRLVETILDETEAWELSEEPEREAAALAPEPALARSSR